MPTRHMRRPSRGAERARVRGTTGGGGAGYPQQAGQGPGASVPVEVIVEDGGWDAPALGGWADRAVAAALDHLGLDPARFEIAILACSDDRIAALNAQFRGRPVATNVLSWPAEERRATAPGAKPPLPAAGTPDDPAALGDLALARETCQREAEAAGKPFSAHVTHLLVHGVLHLLGYDHMRTQDADLMEACEAEILAQLGIANPYLDTGAGRPG